MALISSKLVEMYMIIIIDLFIDFFFFLIFFFFAISLSVKWLRFLFMVFGQAVYVTKFDQSECVI